MTRPPITELSISVHCCTTPAVSRPALDNPAACCIALHIDPDGDPRIWRLTDELRGTATFFWSASDAAKHAIRCISRLRLLNEIPRTRQDSPGCGLICLEVQSHRVWTDWLKSLSPDERWHVDLWRSGGTATETRRGTNKHCECGHAFPSTRHLFEDCPTYAAYRATLSTAHKLPPNFWTNRWRVTSKTGWITTDAARSLDRRANMQVAACRLALHILLKRGPPGLMPSIGTDAVPQRRPLQQQRTPHGAAGRTRPPSASVN